MQYAYASKAALAVGRMMSCVGVQCWSQDDRKKILSYIEGNGLQREISDNITQLRNLSYHTCDG